jgi:hypothetical protein
MYKDIISYELAEGISESDLINSAKEVVANWMSKQKGFINWEINKGKEGNYKDIVHWESREDAVNAEKEMVNIPNAGAWFACYKEGSISSVNLTKIITLN